MVSNARLDLPEPERPVTTISLSRGSSTLMFRRLWTRAPCTAMVVRGAALGDALAVPRLVDRFAPVLDPTSFASGRVTRETPAAARWGKRAPGRHGFHRKCALNDEYASDASAAGCAVHRSPRRTASTAAATIMVDGTT